MNDYFYLCPSEMAKLFKKLSGNEFRVLLLMMYCMSGKNMTVFINNKESRDVFASWGFNKTPERFSTILSSLVKKGAIKREAQAVYSISDSLFKLPE